MANSLAVTPGSFFRWGLTHSDLILKIGAAAAAWPHASTYVERWGIISPVGEAVAPALDELLSPLVTTSESESSLEAKLLAKLLEQPHSAAGPPIDGRWLRAALALLNALLPLLTAAH